MSSADLPPGLAPVLRSLAALAEDVAAEVARTLAGPADASEVAGEGVGDTTFALDTGPEALIAAWAAEQARSAPLSVLTEDRGWRHLGPDGSGGVHALDTFDHGGGRYVFDPVDGTRPLMCGLRSAWFSAAWAPPGPHPPVLNDVTVGLLRELPPSTHSAAPQRWVAATVEGTPRTWRGHAREPLPGTPECADTTAELERRYVSFFKFQPAERVALAELEAAFFARLASEGVDTDQIFDDQYTSNCAQLVLVARGTYRLLADLRAWEANRTGRTPLATKPYDIAAAQLIARGVGAVVHSTEGAPLAVPLDATTSLSFVAYANRATAARFAPHLAAVLAAR